MDWDKRPQGQFTKGIERHPYPDHQPDAGDAGCGCVFLIWWTFAMGIVFKTWEKIADYFAWDKDDRWLYFLWFIGVIIVVVVLWILRWRIKRLLGIK